MIKRLLNIFVVHNSNKLRISLKDGLQVIIKFWRQNSKEILDVSFQEYRYLNILIQTMLDFSGNWEVRCLNR